MDLMIDLGLALDATDPLSTRSSSKLMYVVVPDTKFEVKLLMNYRCEYDGLIWIYYYYWLQLVLLAGHVFVQFIQYICLI